MKNSKKTTSQTKGFSLVEVVVAMVILGIITVALLNSIVSGYVWIIDAGNRTKANAIAEKILDSVYADGCVDEAVTTSNLYALISAGDVDGKVATEADLVSTLYNSAAPDETVFYTVSVKTINSVNYYQFKVLVFYNSGKRFVTLSSLIPADTGVI